MVPLRKNADARQPCQSSISPGAREFVNHLRFVAMDCRAKPRADLFEACALLHVSQSASRDAFAQALTRCLGEALGKPARLLAPGTDELTFDEHWLVQLGIACARDDDASLTFLLRSRVAFENRRLVGFLMGNLSECFSLI
ncbi:MAG: hypothetical protein AAF891_07640 [Pseudomonadota bacterium]